MDTASRLRVVHGGAREVAAPHFRVRAADRTSGVPKTPKTGNFVHLGGFVVCGGFGGSRARPVEHCPHSRSGWTQRGALGRAGSQRSRRVTWGGCGGSKVPGNVARVC